jgi:hypothetical protein
MPLIPMKQTVTITPQGETDSWGNVITPSTPYTLKCRAEETTAKVQNQVGDEVVSSLTLYFDKLPNIKYDDTIEFINELGNTISGMPIKIEPVRGINGKPMMTNVYL